MGAEQRDDKAVKRPTWMLYLFYVFMVAHSELEFYINVGQINLDWPRVLLFPTLITVYIYILARVIEYVKHDPPLLGSQEAFTENI